MTILETQLELLSTNVEILCQHAEALRNMVNSKCDTIINNGIDIINKIKELKGDK